LIVLNNGNATTGHSYTFRSFNLTEIPPQSLPDNNLTLSSNAFSSSDLQIARQYYLYIWRHMPLNYSFNTFVNPNSARGFGVYSVHANSFKPGESIILYLEPIGFGYSSIKTKTPHTIHQISFTVNASIFTIKGKKIGSNEYLFLCIHITKILKDI